MSNDGAALIERDLQALAAAQADRRFPGMGGWEAFHWASDDPQSGGAQSPRRSDPTKAGRRVGGRGDVTVHGL